MDEVQLRKELIRDEGLRQEAYRDSLGYWTIGVGHYLGDSKRMTFITRPEVNALLDADIAEARKIAYRLAPKAFGQWQWQDGARARALVNMAFNLGPRLSQFKNFLAAIDAEAWELAASEMMRSKWAKQVGKRAERLRDMVLNG